MTGRRPPVRLTLRFWRPRLGTRALATVTVMALDAHREQDARAAGRLAPRTLHPAARRLSLDRTLHP
jgi:hypothetical protein